jgi:hypothetical protein
MFRLQERYRYRATHIEGPRPSIPADPLHPNMEEEIGPKVAVLTKRPSVEFASWLMIGDWRTRLWRLQVRDSSMGKTLPWILPQEDTSTL